ncbi:MAG: DUF4956 domain-containing protein [Planctomycetaceae bacterium]|nr:DUF4956 domain-containing protein [Planctomycetaceae bacterium]
MPEWLTDSIRPGEQVDFLHVLARLTGALVFGFVVAAIYRISQKRPKADPAAFVTTLLLMTVLIAMVTLVIGDSVARAFGLVGALSIVRFRTVVEDTRDTAFVIFAVVVGMAVGAGFLLVPLVGVPIVAVAALLASSWLGGPPRNDRSGILSIRVGLGAPVETMFEEVFSRHLESALLTSTATARQGSAMDLVFDVRLRHEQGTLPLVRDLNALEGVQEVSHRLSERNSRG